MMWVNPIPGFTSQRLGAFDYPVIAPTDPADPGWPEWYVPNMDPGTPLTEELYGTLGTPREQQGLPRLREIPSGGEDPDYPGFDAIIHLNEMATIDHIGRLSGSMVHDLADLEHTVKVTFHAVPVLGGAAIQLCDTIEFDLEPDVVDVTRPPAPGGFGWAFWRATDNYNELMLLAMVNFTPNLLGMVEDGTYRLVVDWNFYHKVEPDQLECEPFHGFCDSISFHLTAATQRPIVQPASVSASASVKQQQRIIKPTAHAATRR